METLLSHNEFCIKISGTTQTDKDDVGFTFWVDLYKKYRNNPNKYIDIDGTPLGTFYYNDRVDADFVNHPETYYIWSPYKIKVDVPKTQEFLKYLKAHIGDTFSFSSPDLNEGKPELISLKYAQGWNGFNKEGQNDWNDDDVIYKPKQYTIQIGYVSESDNPVHWKSKKAQNIWSFMFDTKGNLVDRQGELHTLELVEKQKPIKKAEDNFNEIISSNLAEKKLNEVPNIEIQKELPNHAIRDIKDAYLPEDSRNNRWNGYQVLWKHQVAKDYLTGIEDDPNAWNQGDKTFTSKEKAIKFINLVKKYNLQKNKPMAKNNQKEIAELEKAINSPATPEPQKAVMRKVLDKLKAEETKESSSKPAEKPFFREVGSDGYDSDKMKAEETTKKSDYQKELERQLKSGDIKDTSSGISLGALAKHITSKPSKEVTKKPSTKIDNLIVAEVMYRDNANFKDTFTFGVVPSLANQFKIGDDEVSVAMFGFYTKDWQDFLGDKWDDEFGNEFVEVLSITTYVPGMELDNVRELIDNTKWREALKSKPSEKKPETTKPTSDEDYDCDDLWDKEKKRRAKTKERALKKANAPTPTQATKNRDAIEKVGDKLEASIEKRLQTGKVGKSELDKLIDETKALLKMLESYLDKVK
jgi:hypothetical protein